MSKRREMDDLGKETAFRETASKRIHGDTGKSIDITWEGKNTEPFRQKRG